MNGQQFHVTHAEAMLLLVLSLLVMAGMTFYRITEWLSKNIVLLLILRWFFLGRHHHGERRTDATFWHHGTETSRKHGHGGWMDRWEHRPGYQRLLWRWGCLLSFLGLIYGAVTEWEVTSHAVEALIVYGLVCAGFVIESKLRLRVHNRRIITPIVKSLSNEKALRLSPHAVRRLLSISPEDISDEGEVGYIELPPGLTPSEDQQDTIARIIDAHLPVDTMIDWQLSQQPKIGVIRAGLRPPDEVSWDEMLPLMASAAYGDIYFGRDSRKDPYLNNFIHLDDPHWAACVQSKRGKSNWLGLVAVQVLHQDAAAQVTVVDPKEESLIDFLGAPWSGPGLRPLIRGVTMANDPSDVEAMVAAIHRARVLMDRRRSEYARDRTKKFSVNLVILDELNLFSKLIRDYWRAKLNENARLPKDDREDLPKQCPVWDDIADMLAMGRFVGTHVLAVAQDFRADIIGGKSARNLFGLRAMAGFVPSQWKMFIGTNPAPLAQRGKGRWIFWQGEEQDWVQITHCDREKAYAFAAEGREQHEQLAALSVTDGRDTPSDVPASLPPRVTSATQVDTRRVITGMAAAASYLGMKLRAFESAKRRTESDGQLNVIPGEFTQGKNKAWYADDLDKWYRHYRNTTQPADQEV